MVAARRILVVEDESKLASLLADYLIADGFSTRTIADGREVMSAVESYSPDLILLDLNLPGRDGLDVCTELRTCSDVPIVIVTARVEEIDRLRGLEIGADDYICKPFSPRELVARVHAILRRARLHERPDSPRGLVLDESTHSMILHGVPLELTPVEFRLLRTLSAFPGRAFSRKQLVDRLYIDHRVVDVRTVDSHIKNLRKKLLKVSPDHDWIQSIYGVGYKLEIP